MAYFVARLRGRKVVAKRGCHVLLVEQIRYFVSEAIAEFRHKLKSLAASNFYTEENIRARNNVMEESFLLPGRKLYFGNMFGSLACLHSWRGSGEREWRQREKSRGSKPFPVFCCCCLCRFLLFPTLSQACHA